MTKRKPYKTYPKEFKLEAIRLMAESDRPNSHEPGYSTQPALQMEGTNDQKRRGTLRQARTAKERKPE